MTSHDYPHTGYGMEMRTKKGWVLLDGIDRTRATTECIREILIDRHYLDPDEIRVVTLTITRDEQSPEKA